jgi:hypothetical protein
MAAEEINSGHSSLQSLVRAVRSTGIPPLLPFKGRCYGHLMMADNSISNWPSLMIRCAKISL